MDLEYVPITDFVHDDIRARAGVPLDIGHSLAGELERAGLIRIRMIVKRANKMVPHLGNQRPGGEVLPLSASPPGHHSRQPTLHLPKHGVTKTESTGK